MLLVRIPPPKAAFSGSCECPRVGLSRGVVMESVHKFGYGHKFEGASAAPIVA
jgi:hypothetical protein